MRGSMESRGGVCDEGAGSDFASDGEDHLVATGGDRGDQRPEDAAMAGAL